MREGLRWYPAEPICRPDRSLSRNDRRELLPYHLALGNFQLRDDNQLARADDAWRTAACELSRTKASQDGELEGADFNGTLDHGKCLS
jgi:hypothetical protein